MSTYDQGLAKAYSSDGLDNHPKTKFSLHHTILSLCYPTIEGLKVLDAGCGSGRSSRLLASSRAHVTAFDSSSANIELAKKCSAGYGISYHIAELNHISDSQIAESKYDIVVASLVLHYAETMDQLRSWLISLGQLTKKDGSIIASVVHPEKPVSEFHPGLGFSAEWMDDQFMPGSRIRVSLYDKEDNLVTNDIINHWYEKETYETALSDAGFERITWHPMRMSLAGRKAAPNTWKIIEDKGGLITFSATKH